MTLLSHKELMNINLAPTLKSLLCNCVVILESPFIARKTTTQPAVEDVHVNRDAGRGSTYYDFVTFQQVGFKVLSKLRHR